MAELTPVAADTADETALIDGDAFFERAARGEHPPRRAVARDDPERAPGAASLPARPPANAARRAPRNSRHHRELPAGRLATATKRASLAAAGLLATVGAVTLITPSDRPPRPAADSQSPPRPITSATPAPLSGAADHIAPQRVSRSLTVTDSHVAGAVADAGSGIESVALLVDGHPLRTVPAGCQVRCPAELTFTFLLPVDRARDARPHNWSVVSRDASGNVGLAWQRLATGRRQGHARLTAQLATAGQTRASSQPRGAARLRGQLVDAHGSPIRRARIEVFALARTATAAPRRVATARTDRSGRWTAPTPPAVGGRLYVARYRAPSNLATSAPLLRIARIAPTARIRRLPGGARAIAGRLRPIAANAPTTVVIARQVPGRGWSPIGVAAVGAVTGRFELRLAGEARGPFAAFAVPNAGQPFAPAGRVVRPARPSSS